VDISISIYQCIPTKKQTYTLTKSIENERVNERLAERREKIDRHDGS